MERFAAGRKLDLSGSRIIARIGIGTLRTGGLGITAALDLDAPGIGRDDAVYLMRRARTHGRLRPGTPWTQRDL
jgi:hypothetical protein